MKEKPFKTLRLSVNFPFFKEHGLPEDMNIKYSSSVGSDKAEVTGIYDGKTVYHALIEKRVKTEDREQELFLRDRILLACVNQMNGYTENKGTKVHKDPVDEDTKELPIS